MKKQSFDVNTLRVAAPCSVSWETMSGDERARHCHLCELNVYNISEMTKPEVENLIANREGRLCIRLYKRADGTVLTKDCPIGLRAYYKKTARFAGATLAAILGLFSVSFAQKNDDSKVVDASKAKIIRTTSQENILRGVIYDSAGAVIPDIKVKLYQKDFKEGDEFLSAISNADGEYEFKSVPAGNYTLKTEPRPGFNGYELINFRIENKQKIDFDMVLEIDKNTAIVGIFVEEPLIDTTSSGITTTITLQKIEKIPH